MPWAVAIALGAIVAPPDAAAATAVLKQVRPPHRLLVILEGESLFNDASALLIYRLAVVATPPGESAADVDRAIDALGHVPLPPYIHRADDETDRERYQTVFARARGSVAAPTAGLHFDRAMLASLQSAGIDWAALTLHVGYGTFKPVRAAEVEKHEVDAERFDIPTPTVTAIAAARARGGRVVAVGTTTTRALESATGEDGQLRPGPGVADLFIYPGYRFRIVDALLTNFHLPRSSLFMLVCAFAGRELMLAAYRDAIARGFLFYSYGDAMLITSVPGNRQSVEN